MTEITGNTNVAALKEGEYIHYALRLDCDLNGCETRHADHGAEVSAVDIGAARLVETATVNRHAARVIRRRITLTEI